MSKKVLIIKPNVYIDDKLNNELLEYINKSIVEYGIVCLPYWVDHEFGEVDGIVWEGKKNEEHKPEADFKAELDDLIKKINDEMWIGEEINDELDRTHNRALKIAEAIVTAKKERLYGRENS